MPKNLDIFRLGGSNSAFPFDKPIPKELRESVGMESENGMTYTTGMVNVVKNQQHKKQRQWNKKVINDQLTDINEHEK